MGTQIGPPKHVIAALVEQGYHDFRWQRLGGGWFSYCCGCAVEKKTFNGERVQVAVTAQPVTGEWLVEILSSLRVAKVPSPSPIVKGKKRARRRPQWFK